MPATPNGTAWHAVSTTLPNGDVAYVCAADTVFTAGAPAPCMIYAHGNNGPADQFQQQAGWADTRNWLIDHGWFWIEGAGAGNQWGGPRGVAAYEQAYTWGKTIISPKITVGLLRSMGGCYAASFVSSTVIAAQAVIINSGVLDVVYRARPASGDRLAIYPAYNVPEGQQEALAAAAAPYDPMQAPLNRWANVDVLNMWGTADTTVPASMNGQAWREKYAAGCKTYTEDIKEGGDHSQQNGSYTQAAAMTTFFARVNGGGVVPPPEPLTYSRVDARFYWDGALFPIVNP